MNTWDRALLQFTAFFDVYQKTINAIVSNTSVTPCYTVAKASVAAAQFSSESLHAANSKFLQNYQYDIYSMIKSSSSYAASESSASYADSASSSSYFAFSATASSLSSPSELSVASLRNLGDCAYSAIPAQTDSFFTSPQVSAETHACIQTLSTLTGGQYFTKFSFFWVQHSLTLFAELHNIFDKKECLELFDIYQNAFTKQRNASSTTTVLHAAPDALPMTAPSRASSEPSLAPGMTPAGLPSTTITTLLLSESLHGHAAPSHTQGEPPAKRAAM